MGGGGGRSRTGIGARFRIWSAQAGGGSSPSARTTRPGGPGGVGARPPPPFLRAPGLGGAGWPDRRDAESAAPGRLQPRGAGGGAGADRAAGDRSADGGGGRERPATLPGLGGSRPSGG